MDSEVFIVAIVFGSILIFVKMLVDYGTRRKLIEKGLVDEKVKYLFESYGASPILNNVRWGIVLVAVGMAMFWKEIAPYRVSNESVLGLMFILGGVGFLLYYFIAKKQMDKHSNNSPVG